MRELRTIQRAAKSGHARLTSPVAVQMPITAIARDGEAQSSGEPTSSHFEGHGRDTAAEHGSGHQQAAPEHSGVPEAAAEPLEGKSQTQATAVIGREPIAFLEPATEEAQLLLKWIERKRPVELTRK
jgi:hypothetical protein